MSGPVRGRVLTPDQKVRLWCEREADKQYPPLGPFEHGYFQEALYHSGYAKGLKVGYALDNLAMTTSFGSFVARLFGWTQAAMDARQRLLEP